MLKGSRCVEQIDHCSGWAFFYARLCAGTGVRIDSGQVVDHGDCPLRALFYADAAGNTSDGTGLGDTFALGQGGA
jgi:hypothetical protein